MGIVQLPLGIIPWTTHIHPTHLARVKGWAESQVPWCNEHDVRMGAQKVGAPPLLGFPHTMLWALVCIRLNTLSPIYYQLFFKNKKSNVFQDRFKVTPISKHYSNIDLNNRKKPNTFLYHWAFSDGWFYSTLPFASSSISTLTSWEMKKIKFKNNKKNKKI